MKVLIVKTSSMGDVIHTFPALADALNARPDFQFDWCVEDSFVDLVRLHAGVGRIHTVAMRRWRRSLLADDTQREVARFWQNVRAESYDLVIDAQGLLKSAVLSRLTGAPVAGLDGRSAREPLAASFYAKRHGVPRDRHAIDRTRLLFGKVFDYEPDLDGLNYGLAAPAGGGGSERRGVFLLHGTSWPSKHWHLDGWTKLAGGLAEHGYQPVVTFAGPTERRTTEAIIEAVPETRLVQKTGLAEIAHIMARCAGVVGTDTGLTHLACALDRPTVQIALSTAPGLTGPRGNRVNVVAADIECAPCRKRECPLVALGETQPCAPTVGAGTILDRLQQLIKNVQ